MFKLLTKIFGTANDRFIKSLSPYISSINNMEQTISKYSDSELRGQTVKFKEMILNGAPLDEILPEAFATVREASKRVLNQRHYDAQLMGGLVLHKGKITEMRTGEGKTLVATLPAYLNALSGGGVHVVTVNDYLAKRDSEWMGQIYNFLGLSVGSILSQTDDSLRRGAYNADITYATNNELGFDFLRDNMKFSLDERVQRFQPHYAIIDEVDSILIDEARTPLIISGAVDDNSVLYRVMNEVIKQFDKDDYVKDEKSRSVNFTDEAINKLEDILVKSQLISEETGLYDFENMHLVHYVNQSLKAQTLFKIDVDYIVQDNRVMIIDEFTGRVMSGRRFSDGLHQALEAKENVPVQNENQTLASITFQNYFRMYQKLSGMTGTAMTEAEEFKNIYGLDVIAIPPHKKVSRVDHDDVVYGTKGEKNDAIVQLVKDCAQRGQPVLLGTTSIEESEQFSKLLNKSGIEHNVLNAKYHEQEAYIIAQAGRYGMVTIATNMAGRGTDIVLGGNAEMMLNAIDKNKMGPEDFESASNHIHFTIKEEQKQVVSAGGLFVIGTQRHESRRIDNQLRGRSGRQGDPGSTKFFLSLEDDLMRIFASEKVGNLLRRLGLKDGEVIYHPMINRALEKAQQKVEAHNYEIRKNLLKFDDVMNDQRKAIYQQRNDIISSHNLDDIISNFINEVSVGIVDQYILPNSYQEDWDIDNFIKEAHRVFNVDITKDALMATEKLDYNSVVDFLENLVHNLYKYKKENHGFEVIHEASRYLLIVTLDQLWKEHLHHLDHLRQGISLRAYGQKDPLNEYKKEAFNLFRAMLESWSGVFVNRLCYLHLDKEHSNVNSVSLKSRPMQKMHETREDPAFHQFNSGDSVQASLQPQKVYVAPELRDPNDVNSWGKVARNEQCPCGSGKKYKYCHG
jgi:preprotein translocase subunit SecA